MKSFVFVSRATRNLHQESINNATSRHVPVIDDVICVTSLNPSRWRHQRLICIFLILSQPLPQPPTLYNYDYNNYIPTIYFFSIYASSSCCICVKILTLLKSFYAPAKCRILLRLRSMHRRWAAVLTSDQANSILCSTLDLNNVFYYRVSSQLLKFMPFFRQGQTCCFSKWKEKLFFRRRTVP